MSLKHARCPPCPTHLARSWNCKSWGWNGKAIFLHTGRSHCKWLLLHNFVLMQLQNLHHIWINAISHIWFMCKLTFCRRLAERYITVTPSVKCMDWLHRWYNHAAHLVSSSTALAVLNTSEIHKCTSPSAMQVRNWWMTVGTEGKLNIINWYNKGWMKCYIYGNVRIAHSSILTIYDNAGRIKERDWYEKEVFV
jgi:hypothetical protein